MNLGLLLTLLLITIFLLDLIPFIPTSSTHVLIPKVYARDPTYYPIGVSSNGISPSGVEVAVQTNSVMGYAYIGSLSTSGASLQLNVVLVMISLSNFQEYWIQNVIQFEGSQMRFIDNIWNFTAYGAGLNPAYISGNGQVTTTTTNNGQVVSFYYYSTPYHSFSTPMSLLLFINVSKISDGAEVCIGYEMGGSYVKYDTVIIKLNNINNAYILVAPQLTGNGEHSDVELVWGGFSNGSTATFSAMQSQLAIYYKVTGTNLYSPFPEVYNYGFDTAETSSNIQATLGNNNGMVCVTIGNPNPSYLTSYFTPLIPGWTLVTVLSNHYYLVNGYNTTANVPYNTQEPSYGEPYYISYTSPSSITIQLPVFNTTFYRYLPVSKVLNSSGSYNTTNNIITLSNGYYQVIVSYIQIPNLFKVTINVPMWGLLNGTPVLIKSGEYYYGEVIELPICNYTIIGPGERELLIPNVTYIVVTTNITIHVTVVLQYLVNIKTEYPLMVEVNGKTFNVTGNQWFNSSSTVVIPPQYYYLSAGVREELVNPTSFIVSQPNINYTASWITQYRLIINSPLPLYELVNGINMTATHIQWINESSRVIIPPQIYYSSKTERWILTNYLNITMNSPVNFTARFLLQFYVIVPYKALVEVNGSYQNITSGWYNNGTVITVPSKYYYISNDERVVYYIPTPFKITINSSMTITIFSSYQYYVSINRELEGYVNGTLMNITSGWYNNGTTIVFKIAYYDFISPSERIVCSPNITYVIVNKPIIIEVSLAKQFLINVISPYPIKGIVNGTSINFTTGWYDSGLSLYVPVQYYYVNNYSRYVLINNMTITVESPMNFTAIWRLQFYVNVSSNYPVLALVNGHRVNLTKGWYFNGSEIQIVSNKTYPINSTVRYAILSVLPSSNFTLTTPTSITVTYYPQYLVTINGQKSWYFKGSEIRLYTTVPFFESVRWTGTYNLPNGAVITVNKPIVENAVVSINLVNVASVILMIISALLILFAAIKRR